MSFVITVLIIFSVPLTRIITGHLEAQTKLKRAMLKDQLKLEKLKYENFLLETNKLKLEVEKMEKENNLLEKN